MTAFIRRVGENHHGQHHNCNECSVARHTISRGYCQCDDPIIEELPLWGTSQCGRCGREVRP